MLTKSDIPSWQVSLCKKHCELAKEGLINDDGEMADPSSIRIARKYPKKFPSGLYGWAKVLEPKAIE